MEDPDILDNNDIDYFIRHEFNLGKQYAGIYGVVKDNIRQFNKGDGKHIYVYLLQNSPYSTGHWVTVFRKNGEWIYFDPFGGLPPMVIFKKFDNLNVSGDVIQKLDQNDCGIIVLKKIWKEFKNKK